MKKVAIVGVEGSGKTVMLACLGELYTRPDEHGYFLRPENFETAAYVTDKITRMRKGEWPMATAEDAMQGLNWTLCRRRSGGGRPEEVCKISFLDFAGEVYRAAFGIRKGEDEALFDEIDQLKSYISEADDLIVLINLRDVIAKGASDKRVQESVWITSSILDTVFNGSADKGPRASIAITQADSYADAIRTYGGARGVLAEYLPHVSNSYDWLDVYDVTAVDKTFLDNDGNSIPAPDFKPAGLRVLMNWIINLQEEDTAEKTHPLTTRLFRFFRGNFLRKDRNERVKTDVEVLSCEDSNREKVCEDNSFPSHVVRKTLVLPGGATMRMIYVAPGSFMMGSPISEGGRSRDETQHRVKLTKGYWLGETEVTQAQWESVMGSNPSRFKGASRPVVNVSWEDCQKFIAKVNLASKLRLGGEARLPTEAEWEYACRAGSIGRYAGTGKLDDMGWYADNSNSRTHDVKGMKANAWGFYDMHGNVWEWCQDWYGAYQSGVATNPLGPVSGDSRVLRGGSWYGNAGDCRSAFRNVGRPVLRSHYCGFRLCCSALP